MVNAWKPIVAALVIFAAGVVTGGLTLRLAQPQRNAGFRSVQRPANIRGARGDLLDRMQKELGLASEQRERIDQILHDSQDRTHLLWESVAPRAHAEQKHARELIRQELTPGQLARFDESFPLHAGGRFGGDAKPFEDGRRREERRRGYPQAVPSR
jgi:hypothetical protein